MRFGHLLAGFSLPLFAFSTIAQTTQQPAQQQTPPAQSAPAQQQAAPSLQSPSGQQSGEPQLQLRNLPPDAHTPTPEEQAEQKAAQMRMQITRIASAQANWGPAMSTAGNSLELKETGRKQSDAGTEISYQLVAQGFTPDMQLTMVRWPLNQPIGAVMSGIVVDSSGTAVCGGSTSTATPPPAGAAASQTPSCAKTVTPGTPITVTTTVAKGEAIRVGLLSADRKHAAAASVIPFPIEGADKGCKLDVILGAKDAQLVLLKGEGFQKDTNYTLGTESFGQKNALTATINDKGRFTAAITPWVQGHDAGDTIVYYTSSTCTPTVSFHWGKDTYKPQ
jgi:hypothetical protein